MSHVIFCSCSLINKAFLLGLLIAAVLQSQMDFNADNLIYGEREMVEDQGDFGMNPNGEEGENAIGAGFIPDGGLGCFASVLVDGGGSTVTSCTFDHLEELLWMGNSVVIVANNEAKHEIHLL